MPVLHSQNFDSTTVGQVPTGWTAETGWLVAATHPNSGANSFVFTAKSVLRLAHYNSLDGQNGDVTVEAYVRMDSLPLANGAEWVLVARSNATGAWPPTTCYFVDIGFANGAEGVGLYRRSGGATTRISAATIGAAVFTAAATENIYFRVLLNLKGTSIKVRVQRMSDSKYLDTAGAFTDTTPVDCFSVTDSTVTGEGYVGVGCITGATTGDVHVDDVTLANPTSVIPSTVALTLATFAPTVSTPRTVTPTTATLTLTTFAPTVSTPRLVTPAPASLTLTTFAPTVSTPQLVTPAPASLTLTTFAPTVTATNTVTVTPEPATLTVTTFAPTISVSASAPPTGGGGVNVNRRRTVVYIPKSTVVTGTGALTAGVEMTGVGIIIAANGGHLGAQPQMRGLGTVIAHRHGRMLARGRWRGTGMIIVGGVGAFVTAQAMEGYGYRRLGALQQVQDDLDVLFLLGLVQTEEVRR